jgi:poly(ADP-ribose) glycohydrolase
METTEDEVWLVLPSEVPEQWAVVEQVLGPGVHQLSDLDTILSKFASYDSNPRVCTFFATIPGTVEAGSFDFRQFFEKGVPLMIEIALEMPMLFADVQVPIFKMRSSWTSAGTFGKLSFSLTRRQCACLLVHSFFGSLKRPPKVQLNDFRFTLTELFMGTAVSPNSGCTFLNYFTQLGKNGIPNELVTFDRQGYRKGPSPWQWENNDKPLCPVSIVSGNIDDSPADLHVEFANGFIGGGVMTGDAAMEETLFLVKPELMVAMAIQNRMVDEEAICISGAQKYSLTSGYGQSFTFAGDYDYNRRPGPAPKVCAIDAVRGGGPAMSEAALLRDMNKARIAFDGANEIATGHWGCGAFGNNHDLMFLKQWLAASEAGARKLYYHDFDRKQSHHIFPLIRKMGHLTVGQAWAFLQDLTRDLRKPHNMNAFCARIADISVGKIKVPGK